MKFVDIQNLKTLIALVKSADEAVKNGYISLVGEIGEGKTVKSYVDGKVSDINGAADTLAGRVSANETAIALINNTTIDAKITAAFNDFATKVSDDNVVNTFKEMIDYVAAHGTEYANLAALVGTIPAGAAASTIVAYAKEIVDAEAARAQGAESGIVDRVAAVESKFEGDESVEKQIANALKDAKDYTDALKNGQVAANNAAIVTLQGSTSDTKDSVSIVGAKKYADSVAATAQSNAEATASADATSKANAAEKNAKDYCDAEIAKIVAYEASEITAAWNEI